MSLNICITVQGHTDAIKVLVLGLLSAKLAQEIWFQKIKKIKEIVEKFNVITNCALGTLK